MFVPSYVPRALLEQLGARTRFIWNGPSVVTVPAPQHSDDKAVLAIENRGRQHFTFCLESISKWYNKCPRPYNLYPDEDRFTLANKDYETEDTQAKFCEPPNHFFERCMHDTAGVICDRASNSQRLYYKLKLTAIHYLDDTSEFYAFLELFDTCRNRYRHSVVTMCAVMGMSLQFTEVKVVPTHDKPLCWLFTYIRDQYLRFNARMGVSWANTKSLPGLAQLFRKNRVKTQRVRVPGEVVARLLL